MKKILLLIFTFSSILYSSAQITKSNWLIGGTGLFNSTTYNSTTGAAGQRVTDIQLSPNIGYFLVDKFATGLKLGFGSSRYKTIGQNSLSKQTTYSLGPFIRYYFLRVRKQFNLLVDASYQYGIERGGGSSAPDGQPLVFSITQYTKNTFSIAAGPVIYFNPSVGLEFLIGYSSSKYVQHEGNNNTVQVGLGLQVHLKKHKK
ncbi:porin family protein [Ginsengibacter hankyongi]|uniref:Porin family protein n=1 Tax=Ginsengibacter hankyongi TaxID=2607284 RepID=A0A5J5IAT7_9BACT|nr:outer membrane beta-barrel protein [Ginsengibacter hankyongi]KAA9035706.1 porin family protein [Ginsengibacter hankyongi]